MPQTPCILLTNDDGVDAPGLAALHAGLSAMAPVDVVAPARNWSYAAHAKTINLPLGVVEAATADGQPALAVEGTPTDAVSVAILGLLPERPQLVVSGINRGPNLGGDVTYSGTVAAAMEGILLGVPAIACSLDRYDEPDYTFAARFAACLAEMVLREGLSAEVLLNVNFPGVPASEIAGVEITRLGRRIYWDVLTRHEDAAGKTHFVFKPQPATGEEDEGTDFRAIAERKVSITPIHLDLTSYPFIERCRQWQPHLSSCLSSLRNIS